ncbi:MAG: AMP-binding protein [Mobilicoccus sp.]|nr:AMP-binding protein [Mobilicoccus sp.]
MSRTTPRPAVGTTMQDDLPHIDELDIAAGVIPRLRAVVGARGAHVAVVDDEERLTYRELAGRAAEVCARVRGLHAEVGAPVAVLARHDVAAVCAVVGVLASGSPVLVLDPDTPASWARRLLTQVGTTVVIATDDEARAIAEQLGGTVVTTTGDGVDPESLWLDPPAADAPALIAFTSGTTGAHKPVVGDHRLLVRDAWNSAVASCCYDAADVLVHTLPLPFHAGLTTMIHALLVGATVRLVDVRRRGVTALPAAVADCGGTLLVTSPAILRHLTASEPDPALLAGLHGLTVAGDTVYGRDIAAARPLLGAHCVIRNRYGSSEVGLISEHVVTDLPDGRIPVGRPIGWTRMDVVRDDGASAAVGEKGLITVTAPQIALGYWGREDEAFVDNPDGTRTFRTSDLGRRLPDGTIDLTGRSDDTVSVRGYLVDPGEVEAVLCTMPGVRECLVAGQDSRLVAVVVGEAGSDPAGLRARLRERLPGHMVPAEIVPASTLPRTERGKVDRTRPVAAPPAPREPLTHWEQLVGDAWGAVLGTDDLGPDSDFFALGGDSLAAEELMTRLRDDLGVPPEQATSRALVAAPTLREFAAAVRTKRTGGLVPLHTAGDRPPLFVVAGAGGLGRTFGPLARRLGADQPVYALQSSSLEGRGLPERSITAMARRHLQSVRSVTTGAVAIAGHGFGGLVALELARLLEERGQPVTLVSLLDVTPPEDTRRDVRPAWRRAKSDLGLLRAAVQETTGGAQAWRWQVQADTLAHAYTPTARAGRTLVVTADDGPAAGGQASWPHLLGGATHIRVAGGPLTMVRPPYVDAVAAHLRTALDDALAGGTRA